MKFKIIDIPIRDIETDDYFFKISTENDIKNLILSIDSIGLLSCPYLIKKNKKNYQIVSGFKRITACKHLKHKTIRSKVIYKTTSQLDCARIAIADNTFQRKLNVVETSRCYHLLQISTDYVNNLNSLSGLEASINIPLSLSAFRKIEPICLLDKSIQKGIIEGYLSISSALKIGSMIKNEAVLFVDLFRKLNTTLNNQKEIIELITEISIIEDISITNLVCSKFIKEIINSNAVCSQKTKQLKLCLKNRRYPTVTSTLSTFRKKIDQINLNKRVKLNPPKFFEGSSYSLNITFDNYEELNTYKKDLDKIIENSKFLKLI